MVKGALVGAAVFAALTGVASAQQGDGRCGRLLDRLDADDNGRVERSEVMAAQARRFARLDSDRDGVLTEAQFVDAMVERMGARLERRFDRMDADSDGRLTVIEFQAAAGARFDRIDGADAGSVAIDDLRGRRCP
jgi:Ca2+-binding EF-hand superfamily protein